jgi:hypothetical protein
MKFILEPAEATSVRLTKSEQAELQALAQEQCLFWGRKPNVSAAIRKLLNNHRERENLLPFFRLLKMAREANDPDLIFAIIDAISKHFSEAAAGEVFEVLSKSAMQNYDDLSRGPALAKVESGATPAITEYAEDSEYARRYKTWYDALAGFEPGERRRLAEENARFT